MGFVMTELSIRNNDIVNSLFLKAAEALFGTNYTKIMATRSLVF